MIVRIFILVALATSIFSSLPARAQLVQLDTYKDWTVYRQDGQAGRICFISSTPKKLRGDYNRDNRGETRVFVTHGPGKAERDVVSVTAGYVYKRQSEVDFAVDGNKTILFTLEGRAWAAGPSDDQKLITRMKRGNKLIVTGTSSRGNKTIDEYSLSGFTKAKSQMDKLCP